MKSIPRVGLGHDRRRSERPGSGSEDSQLGLDSGPFVGDSAYAIGRFRARQCAPRIRRFPGLRLRCHGSVRRRPCARWTTAFLRPPAAAATTDAVVMRGLASSPPPDPDARFRPNPSVCGLGSARTAGKFGAWLVMSGLHG
jgi:hypothetical protein